MNPNKSKENNKMNTNLATQFKQFVPQEEVPQELKKEVFDSLSTINLIADVFDLFTGKFTSAETQFFELLSDHLAEDDFGDTTDSDDEIEMGETAP
ncbi:MAG: hypothetical protein AB8G15_08255 [Saprospiraceae bacterium]